MKKKLIHRKKNLYNLKGHLFYLFKKKKVKNLLLPKIKNYFELINIFKIIFYYNLFFKYYYLKSNFEIKSEHIFDNLFFKYNIIKNYWYIYLNIYHFIYKKINFKINYIFNIFFIKYFIKNIFKIENSKFNLKKSFSFISKFNIISILKNHEKKKNKSLYLLLKKKRKIFKIELYINKKIKNIIKNIVKIRFSSITFSTYKYTMFSALIKYLINIFNFRKKKEFVYYWIRYYKYCLKKLLANVEVELIKYTRVILKQYNLFNSLISLKEKKKNIFFFFYFFFKRYKYKFLRKCKMFKYFLNIKKLFKSNFFQKNNFSLFFFNKNRLTFSLFLCSYKNKIKKIKFLIKIKALIFIKNFIFLILLQTLILWFNYYYLVEFNISTIRNINYTYFNFSNINIKNIPLVLTLIKTYNWNRLSFLTCNYFFYNNIIIKKSSEIGKRKNF